MTTPRLFFVLALSLSGCASQAAPEPMPPIAPPLVTPPVPAGLDALLHPPALILDHQAALALTPEQVTSMQAEMQRTQSELVELEWRLGAAREQLGEVLSAPEVDEALALERAGAVADVEREIELAHLRLLVRLENQLTSEQEARLDGLR
jgi:Spy/CpxP family protein refolding chaperone